MERVTEFVRALFDFNFNTFVTPALIKPLYVLAVVLIGLGSLVFLLTSLLGGFVFAIVLAPVFFLVYVAFARMYAEMALVLFDVNDRLESLGGRRPE